MASTFPGAIDNFTDPLSNSSLSSPSHAGQHSDLNDAVEKIETYMGLVFIARKTFSAQATWNCTSVFSSLYDNYLAVLACDTAPAGGAIVQAVMLSGTTPATGANYASAETGLTWAGGADNTFGGTAGTYYFGARSASFFFANMQIYSPFRAIYTSFSCEGVDLTQSWNSRGIHQLNTSYDGIRFSQAGNMSGYVDFYGYRKS